MNFEIGWPPPSGALQLAQTDVHVWAVSLDGDSAIFEKLLSAPELKRAAAFHFEVHRRRFTIGRGLLRLILSRYLGLQPELVEFAYGPQGKPELSAGVHSNGLRFNLAHAEDLAIVAITRLGSVGVDLEKIAPLKDADDLVGRFFSAGENARFQQLSTEQKAPAFFNLWTRKEAWLKATGEGIGHSLHLVEVSFLPGEPARLLSVPKHLSQGARWSLYELKPAAHFTAALAIAGEPSNVQCWRWDQTLPSSLKEGFLP